MYKYPLLLTLFRSSHANIIFTITTNSTKHNNFNFNSNTNTTPPPTPTNHQNEGRLWLLRRCFLVQLRLEL